MLPEGNWITQRPQPAPQGGLAGKVQDEGGHGLYLLIPCDTAWRQP